MPAIPSSYVGDAHEYKICIYTATPLDVCSRQHLCHPHTEPWLDFWLCSTSAFFLSVWSLYAISTVEKIPYLCLLVQRSGFSLEICLICQPAKNGLPLQPGGGNGVKLFRVAWYYQSDKSLGNMVSVSVFGQQMIILNSAKTASDLLDKKGSIYSDRPRMEMGGELVGWKNTLVLVGYGERFRNYRRLFHQLIGSHDSMSQFNHVEEIETHKFLKRLLCSPQNLAEHVRRFVFLFWPFNFAGLSRDRTAGAIILRISHGYAIKEDNDPFVHLANVATEQFSLSTSPGTFLVNLVPACKSDSLIITVYMD